MSIRREVLALLSDGRIHSGTKLGQVLGVTRAAIHRQMVSLAAAGLPIERLRGRGYRLRESLTLLDGDRIRARIDRSARPLLRELVVYESIDSTNSRLLAREDLEGVVLLAEHQSAGRGRRGARWHASAFGNLLFSVGWRYEGWPASLTTFSLACAVAVARGLNRCGVEGVGIKWPNDILRAGRKLGGILIEARGESAGPCRLVVGVGLNVRMGSEAGKSIDQAWTDLAGTAPQVQDRNRLAAALISEILAVLDARAAREAWRAAYDRLDALRGRRIVLRLPDSGDILSGTALGIDDGGALLVRDGRGLTQRFHSAEVSVRTA